jgi:FSR family fosmidomycin resistance protein-like MFS transporter
VLGQAYLPSRVGLASGVTLGLAIGLGGVEATALGVIADHSGLRAVLWTVAVIPIPAILLAFSLPAIPAARRRRAMARVGTSEAGDP